MAKKKDKNKDKSKKVDKTTKERMIQAGWDYINAKKSKPDKVGASRVGYDQRLRSLKKKRDSLRSKVRNMKK